MITGDHPLTARAIARKVGLIGDPGDAPWRHGRGGPGDSAHPAPPNAASDLLTGPELDRTSDEAFREVVGRTAIYARTTPEHKLRIVRALRVLGLILITVTLGALNELHEDLLAPRARTTRARSANCTPGRCRCSRGSWRR